MRWVRVRPLKPLFVPPFFVLHQLLVLTPCADRDRDRDGSWRWVGGYGDADAGWDPQVQGDIATCVPAVGRAKVCR